MILTAEQLIASLGAWLWPFFRIAAVLTAAPIFGATYTPVRTRLALAVALALAIVPLLEPAPPVDPFSPQGFTTALSQILTGLAIGFSVRLAFAVFEVAGQIIAQSMGLGFAAMVDPQTGAQVPVVSQLYVLLATLVFLALNGHLVFIQVIVESFRVLPVAPTGLPAEAFWQVARQGSWMFAAAILVALPAVVALLLVNMAFAVMTRTAPQLNIFAVGFPVMLVLGLVAILLSLPTVIAGLDRLFGEALGFAASLAGTP